MMLPISKLAGILNQNSAPPGPPTTATLSLPSTTATTSVAQTGTITLDAVALVNTTCSLSISNSGTLSTASPVVLSGQSSVTFTYSWPAAGAARTITLNSTNPSLTPAGTPRTVTVSDASGSLVITGPSSGIARTLSTIYTVTHTGTLSATVTVTLSDGDSNSRFYSMSSGDAAGTVTLSPSVPSARFFYAPASAGSKSVIATNNGGLTNPSALAYTATAAAGSATPFRLTRGGSTIGSYARLQQCRDAGWVSGDLVKVAAGTYAMSDDRYDVGSMSVKDNWPGGIETGVNLNVLTIEAEDINDPPLIDASWWCAAGVRSGGQPQFVTAGIPCHNLTLRGIRMRGSAAPSGSTIISAAFWQLTDFPAADGAAAIFTFDRCLFTGWGDAIKARYHLSTSFYVNSCVFIDNSDAAAGLHHDIYTGNNALTEVVGCTFIRTGTTGYKQDGYGHFVKSRCRTTTVRANRFYAYMDAQGFGGANSLINTPCGGVVEVTGNILIDYGAMGNGSAHNILRSAEQQFPTSGEPSTDPLLTTHSYLIAQNTMLQLRGYPLGDGNSVRPLALYHIPSNDPNGTVVSSGVPTYAMTGSGTMVAVTSTIRNNIVANYDSAQASTFLSQYPNNTLALTSEVSEFGYYSGGTVVGSPAVNDAALEWVGDYTPPTVRADTNRGGRSQYVPAWVPATLNQWTDIPGSNFSAYTSGWPATSPEPDNSGTGGYAATWDFGGPVYSPLHHEVWLFGGGHSGSTVNALTRLVLNAESPYWEVVNPGTDPATRVADWANTGTYGSNPYHSASTFNGQLAPKSPHAYNNNVYLAGIDSFAAVGLGGVNDPVSDIISYNAMCVYPRSGTAWQDPVLWPTVTSPTSYGHQGKSCWANASGSAVFWADKTSPIYKMVIETKVVTALSNSLDLHGSRVAAKDDTTALMFRHGDTAGVTQWQLHYIDLVTGVPTSVSVTDAAFPGPAFALGLVYVPSLDVYYLALMTGTTAVVVYKLTPTGAASLSAELLTTTGIAPVRSANFVITGFFYDPTFKSLIVAANNAAPAKILRLH